MNNSGLYLLSFCSKGSPWDLGRDLSANSEMIRLILSPYFNEIYIYSPEDIKTMGGTDFCNQRPGEFPLNPGINDLGCGDFKPFLIDHTLKMIPEGSILIYHDCNFSKYPQYWQTDWKNLYETCSSLLEINKSDIFMPFETPIRPTKGIQPKVRMHGKRHTTLSIIKDPIEAEIVSECYEIASGRMVIRNSNFSRDFFSEYLRLCSIPELIEKYPNPNPYPQFTHHCPEQHILNCLIYKYILDGKLDPLFPRFMFPMRRLLIDDDVKSFVNHKLTKYLSEKSIQILQKEDYDNDFRGTKEFGEDIFST